MNDPETTVRTLLATHGLTASDAEVAVLVGQYETRRQGVELLHAVPAARYESPALVFSATPTFADWNEQKGSTHV
jgi:hypothetical protein